jgi:2-keto-4-pentenoate hydratase
LDESALQKAVEALVNTRRDHVPFDGFTEELRPGSEAEGYLIQDALLKRFAESGFGPRAGHKIGCTTKVMQEYLEISNPCAGGVYETTTRFMNGIFSLTDFVRVGVECEIAVRLADDLTSRGAVFVREDVVDAVEACMVAIEIVDDRYTDFTRLGAPTLIADDFFGAGCVLGPELTDFNPFDLDQVTASMLIDGVSVGSGVGSDVLGHPLDALSWLANNATTRASGGLRAGEFVLLGSLVQTKWIENPCEVRVTNDPLGEIVARFE